MLFCFIYLISVMIERFDVLSGRLSMYRRAWVVQRKEISFLKKMNRRLKRQVREFENFLFGPILDGFVL
jgi:hypothetical protein